MPQLNRCLPQEQRDFLNENIERLYQISFISAGEDTIEITAVFRNYYYGQTPEDKKNGYHGYALHYYIDFHKELTDRHQFRAVVYAEIAYHLTCLDRVGQLKNYLPGNVSTFKQLAKTLYQRDKNYVVARQIYHVLNSAHPDDVGVLSYLGRCYARQMIGSRPRNILKMQSPWLPARGKTPGIYTAIGAVYMEDAQRNFSKAGALLQQECGYEDDAGILAAEGFLMECDHDIAGAVEKYEAALAINGCLDFTISNCASLLRRCGNTAYADKLEGMLSMESFDGPGESTDNFYSGFDIIDVDTDLYDE